MGYPCVKMNFFDIVVFSGIQNFTEDGCARLLVFGKNLLA